MADLYIAEDGRIIDQWIQGTECLGRTVVNNLFNKITTALYSPFFGTDLKTLPQQNISDDEFQMKFSLLISEIETKMKAEQDESPSSPDEMLDKIVVRRLYKDPFKRWKALLRVFAQSEKYYDLEKNVT